MKALLALFTLFSAFLGYRVLALESAMDQLQTNTAIAVLSAEAANIKIGAIAPFFGQDKEAFAKAWLDTFNMPLAVFPSETLNPIKQRLAEKRADPVSQRLKAATFP